MERCEGAKSTDGNGDAKISECYNAIRRAPYAFPYYFSFFPSSLLFELFTFLLPYCIPVILLRFIFRGNRGRGIWSKLSSKIFRSLTLLPDYNKLVYTWKHHGEVYYIIDEIYILGVYDHFFAPQMGFTVVDVGAHIGVYTLHAAKKVGTKGLIIAIEPEDENYELLTKNVRMNCYRNVIPLRLAVSSLEGTFKLHLNSGSGSHSLKRKTDREIDVYVTTLAKLLKELKVDRVDLLKIDVEGAELEVLIGSEEFLNSHKISKIVVAAYHGSTEAKEIQEYLEAHGYKVCNFDVLRKRVCRFVYGYLGNFLPKLGNDGYNSRLYNRQDT